MTFAHDDDDTISPRGGYALGVFATSGAHYLDPGFAYGQWRPGLRSDTGANRGPPAEVAVSPRTAASATNVGIVSPSSQERAPSAGLQLRLLSPAEFAVVRTPQQSVRIAVRCTDGAVTRVVAVLDGKPLAQSLTPEDARGVQVVGA